MASLSSHARQIIDHHLVDPENIKFLADATICSYCHQHCDERFLDLGSSVDIGDGAITCGPCSQKMHKTFYPLQTVLDYATRNREQQKGVQQRIKNISSRKQRRRDGLNQCGKITIQRTHIKKKKQIDRKKKRRDLLNQCAINTIQNTHTFS